ncbi:uncharacterized protein ACO6RY_20026 [Pungitius sinensis]
MLLPLCFVLAGGFCSSFADPPQQTVLQGTEATLLCPDEKPDVTWKRLINGKKVDLLTVKNGKKWTEDQRYGYRAPTSLVIRNVTSWDSTMYWCNGKMVYLNVAERVGPDAGHEGRTPAPGGPGPRGSAVRSPPRRGRGPVGMVVGAALVVLGVLTLNFCSRNRTEKSTELHEAEAIYEEIDVGVESYFESPHHVTRVGEMANELLTGGHGGQECVYSLAQNPLSTGRDDRRLSH